MTREQLIQKWLDHDLTKSEEQAFIQLEDYAELTKLSRAMKHISLPDFETELELKKLQKNIKPKTKLTAHWKKILLPIAAVLIICFGIFKFSNNQIKTVKTIAAQIEKVTLPDTSIVQLNANSSISYSKKNWNNNRNISLNGEAHFKVAKGKKFVVQTTQGKVTVLGTQFNINDRNSFFEVVCFEGSVQVNFKNTIHVLKPGEIFSSENGLSFDSSVIDKIPTWINGKSTFKSKQYKYVLTEFERQYNLKFKVRNIDTNQIFTGSFPHNNLEKALQAITLPLHINATIIDTKNIQLSSE
ncbi:anti-sigma factor [Patiriisocius marinistellae]|uniref:Anti-sigma factor n=1 Tax=Patiriisocius marinistellae TaxID=2494560 RepID=A0A5J4FXY6_9FLAO|nr:FecR family protein [Patiriisocius marinistellae]GEQ84905.1 anti-sigma factor [Patiriisocius marinistellae]